MLEETSTKQTEDNFACSICCEMVKTFYRKQNQKIVCPKCGIIVCRQCQFRFERDQCMNCEETFTREFILQHLGASFLKEVVKPRIIRELMEAEEQLLPDTQTIVNQQRRLREVKRNLRFGMIDIRSINGASNGMTANNGGANDIAANNTSQSTATQNIVNGTFRSFPCPRDGCRGFIEDTWTCGLCTGQVCPQCHIELSFDNNVDGTGMVQHQCRKEDLETLKVLERETKPCPRCRAAIFKIEGCNDMYCTHCCTHFCWRTGRVLRRSTNGHYLNLARYAENVATVGSNSDNTQQTQYEFDGHLMGEDLTGPCRHYHFHLNRPSVSESMLEHSRNGDPIPSELKRALLTDSEAIRTLFRLRYQRESIIEKSTNTLEGLRVKYLEGQLEYEVWSNRVYLDFRKREQSLQISETLQLYLSTIGYLQNQLVLGRMTPIEVMNNIVGLVELCNLCFHGIQSEYGGKIFKIRHPQKTGPAPSFLEDNN